MCFKFYYNWFQVDIKLPVQAQTQLAKRPIESNIFKPFFRDARIDESE